MECMGRKIEVDSAAKALGVKLGVMCFSVDEKPAINDHYLKVYNEALYKIKAKLLIDIKTLENLKSHPVVRAYRDFYWKIGIDPTKTRPAGEALARRLLSGKGIDAIEPVVDAGNLASAETMVSIGLYDVNKLPGDLKLTVSNGGEKFYPIGKDEEMLPKGLPILLSKDVVVHLFPHRDSRLTSIDINSRVVLGLVAGVPGISDELLIHALNRILVYMQTLGITYKICIQPNIII